MNLLQNDQTTTTTTIEKLMNHIINQKSIDYVFLITEISNELYRFFMNIEKYGVLPNLETYFEQLISSNRIAKIKLLQSLWGCNIKITEKSNIGKYEAIRNIVDTLAEIVWDNARNVLCNTAIDNSMSDITLAIYEMFIAYAHRSHDDEYSDVSGFCHIHGCGEIYDKCPRCTFPYPYNDESDTDNS